MKMNSMDRGLEKLKLTKSTMLKKAEFMASVNRVSGKKNGMKIRANMLKNRFRNRF
jgi:hypothetical protein